MILLSTLSVIRHLIDGNSQNWLLSFENWSDLEDTVDWNRKWIVDFNAGKTQLVSIDQSNNIDAIDVMNGSVLEEK